MRIYLTGPRASGKTTLGCCLSRTLDGAFLDSDELVVKRLGGSIADYVSANGWDAFRREEHEALRDTVRLTGGAGVSVISTGGGIVLLEQNRELMRQTGFVVYLGVPVDELVRRLTLDPAHAQRPSLTGADIREEVAQVVAAREPLYRETAHCVVDGRSFTPDNCENILLAMQQQRLMPL